MVDASDIAIGAVLQQLNDGTWHPTAFFSKKLTPTERRYSTFGRELLAVYSNGGTHTARELRQLAYISEFTTDIRHVKGSDNVVADALSRSAINFVNDPEGVNFDALAAAQRDDEELKSLLTTKTALKLQTTAYHPIRNGMVERFHRQLKSALAATEERNWMEALPLILLGIRTAVKTDIGCSAAELVYGTTLCLPGEFFTGSPQDG
ncbi:uncharacterized protein LOC119434526, partial [Dermacentor silvarum]|uniref:uncharacterized protein LOC119434526 n=1 Tax=Dermacentor silvarum TaxID=543639 RepID=UPI00189942E1